MGTCTKVAAGGVHGGDGVPCVCGGVETLGLVVVVVVVGVYVIEVRCVCVCVW